MGADRAIHVDVPEEKYKDMQPIHVSKILAKLATSENIDILIVGKQVCCVCRGHVYVYLMFILFIRPLTTTLARPVQ